MSTETAETAAPDEDVLHGRADDFVAGMDRCERVDWLKGQGFTDRQVLDALLDPEDRDLDELCRDAAHQVASDAANGAWAGHPVVAGVRAHEPVTDQREAVECPGTQQ